MTEAAGPVSRRAFPLVWAAVAVALAAVVGIAAGVAVHVLRSSPAAPAVAQPELHGQAVWAPGKRPAPAFALADQEGRRISLASLRGRPVVLTFLDSLCRNSCPIEGRQLASVLRRLPVAQRPTLVVVSADPGGDTPGSIWLATHHWGLAGAWRWHWLTGSKAQLAAVWREYGISVDVRNHTISHSLVLMLIDRRGYERTAYLFPFLPAFVQGDLGRLAREPL